MTAVRIQGVSFCVAASLLTLALATVLSLSERAEVTLLAALVLLLGVPHGALDTIFASRIYRVRTLAGWVLFTVSYLLLVALVVLVWRVAPAVFLIGFLIISMFHFSGDAAAGTPRLARLFYGGAIIMLPAIFHSADQAHILAYLAGGRASEIVMPWLRAMSLPWLAGTAVSAIVCARRNWLTALEIASVALLASLAPLLIAFAIFFCGMHSARHILRTFQYSGRASYLRLAAASVAPLAGAFLLFAVAYFSVPDLAVEARVIQVLFVGLAALTVPHMALVERVRLNNWVPSQPSPSARAVVVGP